MSMEKYKMRRSLLGAIVGDALGVPYEFMTRASVRREGYIDMRGHGTHNQPKGTWSDDSSLILATAASLAECGRVNWKDIARRFVDWRNRGRYSAHGSLFDIGGETGRSITKLERLKNPWLAGRKTTHSQGNGSLMRILPVALFVRNLPRSRRRETIARASMLTHAHPNCVNACILYGEMVANLLANPGVGDAYSRMLDENEDILDQSPELKAALPRYIEALPDSHISGSGWVVNCLQAAIWCVLKHTGFSDTVQAAVLLGDDTDTTACVAGGLAGIIYSGIPESWIDALANQKLINETVDGFVSEALKQTGEQRKPLFQFGSTP